MAATSTCPPTGSGSQYDTNCQTVKMSITLAGRAEPLVFEATRRTDTYCARVQARGGVHGEFGFSPQG